MMWPRTFVAKLLPNFKTEKICPKFIAKIAPALLIGKHSVKITSETNTQQELIKQ